MMLTAGLTYGKVAVRTMKEHALPPAARKILPAGGATFFEPLTAFAALKACVIGALVQRATAASPARVWVPGCGSGHDAYGIAMLLFERCAAGGLQPNFKIFATDADDNCVNIARAGRYLETELANVSAERRHKFFTWCGIDRFQVTAALRNCVVFAAHELTTDPPLSRLDLVCCRNVFPGVTPELQPWVIELLHFALREGGHLLLGSGDSIGPACELFEPLSLEGNLYRRLGVGRRRLSNGFIAALTQARAAGLAAFCRASDEPCVGGSGRAAAPGAAREDLLISREELQSLNEELTAVNTELAAKVGELDSACNDLMHLLAVTNICIVFLDAGLHVTRFTAPAATLLGLRDRDIGRLCGAIMKGFDAELSIDARLVIESNVVAEKNVRTRHGRCYLRRIQPHRAGTEREAGVVVTYVDITNQLATDAQLSRFAAVLRDSEDAILVVDFQGWIKAWNRGAERLYGYTETEALRLNMRDLAAGEQAENTAEVMRRVANGEIVPSFDAQRRTRDGRIVDVSATVALLFDDAGNPESLATTERDITARRRSEEATRKLNARLEQRIAERATELQHSEEQIRAILDATADAVVTINVLGRIATFNRAAERIFGYSADEVIGENVTILIPAHERVGHYGNQATAARSYATRFIGRSHEISARRKDGTVFPIQLSLNSVEGRDLFVGVARDMTEHKALQKEIIDVAMLEQRRIGQELHDGTQQELTGLGLLALNLADTLSRNGATLAGQVAARVARGIELANQQVRSLARGMVPVPVDREGLMSALAELARQTTEIHGLPCGFECPAPVEIDNDNEATHLYRIAQEAVSNATRHAKASAIWIRLEQVNGLLLLEVQDNGIGLQTPGLPVKGVGLRLMEHRCAMIGGTFTIDHRPDGGTCIACSVSRPETG
jgi:PAS domain S-box-containing protein